MAGIARPDDNILIGSGIEMTDYEIIGYYSSANQWHNNKISPYNLFDNNIGNYPESVFQWYLSGDYMIIKINKPCNLYVYLKDESNSLQQRGLLNIIPSTYEQQYSLEEKEGWQLSVTSLQSGTYKFAHNELGDFSGYRINYEWFFEEIITSSGGNTDEGDNTGSGTEEGGNTGDGTGEDNSGEDNTQENKGPSKVIKSTVKDVIVNNKLFQEHVSIQERDE